MVPSSAVDVTPKCRDAGTSARGTGVDSEGLALIAGARERTVQYPPHAAPTTVHGTEAWRFIRRCWIASSYAVATWRNANPGVCSSQSFPVKNDGSPQISDTSV